MDVTSSLLCCATTIILLYAAYLFGFIDKEQLLLQGIINIAVLVRCEIPQFTWNKFRLSFQKVVFLWHPLDATLHGIKSTDSLRTFMK
ncbi:hypothetical protein Trydic_g15945 [Trypoxylus dichotomus]